MIWLPEKNLFRGPKRQRGVINPFIFGSGPSQNFTFNPSFTSGSITLSSGNLVASTTTTSSGQNFESRGTVAKNSGQWQFEFVVTAIGTASTSSFLNIGLEDNTRSFPSSPTFPGFSNSGGLFSRAATPLVRFYTNSNTFTSITPTTGKIWTTGDIGTVTIDFATKTIDVYRNGVFVYGQVVSAMSSPTTSYAPAIRMGGVAGTPTVITIPTGALTYPVSGFLGVA